MGLLAAIRQGFREGFVGTIQQARHERLREDYWRGYRDAAEGRPAQQAVVMTAAGAVHLIDGGYPQGYAEGLVRHRGDDLDAGERALVTAALGADATGPSVKV